MPKGFHDLKVWLLTGPIAFDLRFDYALYPEGTREAQVKIWNNEHVITKLNYIFKAKDRERRNEFIEYMVDCTRLTEVLNARVPSFFTSCIYRLGTELESQREVRLSQGPGGNAIN